MAKNPNTGWPQKETLIRLSVQVSQSFQWKDFVWNIHLLMLYLCWILYHSRFLLDSFFNCLYLLIHVPSKFLSLVVMDIQMWHSWIAPRLEVVLVWKYPSSLILVSFRDIQKMFPFWASLLVNLYLPSSLTTENTNMLHVTFSWIFATFLHFFWIMHLFSNKFCYRPCSFTKQGDNALHSVHLSICVFVVSPLNRSTQALDICKHALSSFDCRVPIASANFFLRWYSL